MSLGMPEGRLRHGECLGVGNVGENSKLVENA